jgi:hypothetical protein
MTPGIKLIAQEREEQIEKHGRTIQSDLENNSNGELLEAAVVLTGLDGSKWFPDNWDVNLSMKMIRKSKIEKLVIAGALIAAEIDRQLVTHSSYVPQGIFVQGQQVKTFTYDEDDKKLVSGVVLQSDDDSVTIQWEDLDEPTGYDRKNDPYYGEIQIEVVSGIFCRIKDLQLSTTT